MDPSYCNHESVTFSLNILLKINMKLHSRVILLKKKKKNVYIKKYDLFIVSVVHYYLEQDGREAAAPLKENSSITAALSVGSEFTGQNQFNSEYGLFVCPERNMWTIIIKSWPFTWFTFY